MDRSMEFGTRHTSTLADGVYEQLHSSIALGQLPPNEILIEAEVASRMQVSRTPVREALQRLAREGLVVSRSRRWVVAQLHIADIRNIYEVRAVLESYAARMAIERATSSELADISEALSSRGQAGPGVEEFVASNEQFHRSIAQASGNPRLMTAIENNKHFYFSAQVAKLYATGDLAASHREHESLLEAIKNRDADSADRITHEHIAKALAVIEQRSREGLLR